MRTLFIILPLFLSTIIAITPCVKASSSIDSLRQVLPQTSGKQRIRVLNDIAWAHKSTNAIPDSIRKYANEALTLSKTIQYYEGQVVSLRQLGLAAEWVGKASDALDYYHLALDIAEQNSLTNKIREVCIDLGIYHKNKSNYSIAENYLLRSLKMAEATQDSTKIARVNSNLGNVYRHQRHMTKALKCYLTSLKIHTKTQNTRGQAIVFQNLGVFYHEIDSSHKALQYFEKARSLYEQIGDKRKIAACFNNEGLIHLYQDRYSKAEEFFQKALKSTIASKNIDGQSDIYNNLGYNYELQKDYDKAIKYYHLSRTIDEQYEDPKGLTISYRNIADLYIIKKQYDSALHYFNKCITIADSIGELDQKYHAIMGTIECYESIGKLQEAYELQKIALKLNDSIHAITSNQEMRELLLRFEAGQLEQERRLEKEELALLAAEESRHSYFMWAIVMAFVLTALLGYLVIQKFRKRFQTLKILETARLEERKLIGHYLDDSTGAVFSYAQIYMDALHNMVPEDGPAREQFEKAQKLVQKANELVREASHNLHSGVFSEKGLFSSLKELIEEIHTGSLQVETSFRGNEKLLDPSNSIFIYHAVRELLTNVVKHAKAKHVSISLMVGENIVNLSVSDDGVGLNESSQEFKAGIGVSSLIQQAKSWNGQLKITINNGTRIDLNFPIQQPEAGIFS